MLSDSGSPWGTSGQCIEDQWTVLTVWLLRLGIQVVHGQPYHPQTQGRRAFSCDAGERSAAMAGDGGYGRRTEAFAAYRETYNHIRPHEALGMACPGQRFTVSPRGYPSVLRGGRIQTWGRVVRLRSARTDGFNWAVGRMRSASRLSGNWWRCDRQRVTISGKCTFATSRSAGLTRKEGVTLGRRQDAHSLRLASVPHAEVNFQCVTHVPAQVLPMS